MTEQEYNEARDQIIRAAGDGKTLWCTRCGEELNENEDLIYWIEGFPYCDVCYGHMGGRRR